MKRDKKIAAVIPARMASSRFPGKPLEKILELPMIEHVRRRAVLCSYVDEVVVATCDKVIMDTVASFGGKAVMTSDKHERCTDRVEEAARGMDADIIVILQGDEPLFFPEIIDELVAPLLKDDSINCTNLLSVINDEADLNDIDIIKTIIDNNQHILYFSRAAVPYQRVRGKCRFYRQTGVSAFRKDFLHNFARLSPTPLEAAESIDFLRILEHGLSISAVICDQKTVGVDRPDDIGIIEGILKEDVRQKQLYKEIFLSCTNQPG